MVGCGRLKATVADAWIPSLERSRDPFKIRDVFQLERLAMVPRIFDGRQCPEVAFRIQYDPVPIRLWLSSPGAAFITGQDITVDGGFTAQ